MRKAALVSVIAFALAATACGDDDDTQPDAGQPDAGQPDAGQPDGGVPDGGLPDGGAVATGQVRLIHASPDTPAIDVYAKDGTDPLAEDLAYGEATEFIEVPAGTVAFDVRLAGLPVTTPASLTTPDVTIESGKRYTAIAAGLLSSTDADASLRALQFTDDFAAPAAGTARVRLVHASPDAPTVSIDVGNDGTVELPSLARFDATAAEGVALPAGQQLQVGIGTGSSSSTIATFTVPALPDGASLYVVATGLVAQPPDAADGFVLLPVTDTGALDFIRQNPTVQVFHAISDAPEVNLFVGTDRIVGSLALGQLSPPVFTPPGTYTIDAFPTAEGDTRPTTAPAVTVSTGALEAGKRYLAVLHGTLATVDTAAPALLVMPAAFGPSGGGTRLRFVHAASSLGTVNVGRVSNGGPVVPIFANVAYGTATGASGDPLPSGATSIELSVPPSTDAVASFDVTLPSGGLLNTIAFEGLTPGSPSLGIVTATTFPWTASVTDAVGTP